MINHIYNFRSTIVQNVRTIYKDVKSTEVTPVGGKQLIYALFYLLQEEFEDTKGVIRIRKSKKNRQHNGFDLHVLVLV